MHPQTKLLFAVLTVALLAAPVRAQSSITALRFGALIDSSGKSRPNATVLVQGDTILRVAFGPMTIPTGAKVVDLRRYTAIPGLIDVHTHMTYWRDKSKPASAAPRSKDSVVMAAAENARKTLETGVTTVRDLGASNYTDIAMRDSIDKGVMIGPRMFVAGYGLSKVTTPQRAGAPSAAPRGRVSDTVEIKEAIKAQVDAGANWIKMYGSTGSFQNVTSEQTFSDVEMRVATETAHRYGKSIAIHSYGPAGGRAALRAGAESVEHPAGLDDATIAEWAKLGAVYVPTIDHNRFYAENASTLGYSREQVAALDSFRLLNLETAKRAHNAGVKFAMGSDAVYWMFGENTRELAWFVQAGMTPAQSLATATTNAAALLRMSTKLGKVAKGYYADIVAVEGNPVNDIQVVINHVAWVMKAGAVVVDKRATPAPETATGPFEVHEATIAQLQSAMTDGRATSLQLVEAYLARISAFDSRGPVLNSMIRLNPQARAEARWLDAERRAGKVRGPMHGVPIILKDNFNTFDMPTSAGLLALANHQTSDDAFVVKRLRDAGAIILGKSNMHELAAGITSISSLGGQTRNPYDPRRCPGGSSGGTGAAIAASFAAVGWGSDTCGSIRIPSAFGSLVGLRPTQGLVSRTGVMPLSHTQDIAGPLARTVTDLAIALDITVGADPADPQAKLLEGYTIPKFQDALTPGALRGARIGILRNYFVEADAEIIDTVRAAIRAMARAGADTVGVDVTAFDDLLAGTTVINYEHKFDLIDYLKATPQPRVTSMTDILASGLYQDVLEQRYRLVDSIGTRDSRVYQAALAKQRTTRDAIVKIMDSLRVDVLIYPTVRRRPVLAGDPQLGSTCNLSAQTGLPAISVPAGFMTEGLPVAIELLGRPFADAKLVSLAYAFEQLGARRRAPFSTPALIRGVGPIPVAFATVARGKSSLVNARFIYNPSLSTLAFNTAVTGTPKAQIDAVVLRRRDSVGRTRVIHRFSGPEATTASGVVTLTAIDRDALASGALLLSLVTVEGTVAETALRLPR